MFETQKTDDPVLAQGRNGAVVEEDFIPVYARGGRTATGAGGGKIKTWMILVPLGLLVVGGLGIVVLTSDKPPPIAPLAEPAFSAPLLPSAAAPVEAADAPAPAVQAPAATRMARAPVVREATPAPARAAAPARRAEPRAATPPVARVPAPAAATGPQSYAPAPAPTPAATPTPRIVIAPVG